MSLQAGDICEIQPPPIPEGHIFSQWKGVQLKLIKYLYGKTWQVKIVKIPKENDLPKQKVGQTIRWRVVDHMFPLKHLPKQVGLFNE